MGKKRKRELTADSSDNGGTVLDSSSINSTNAEIASPKRKKHRKSSPEKRVTFADDDDFEVKTAEEVAVADNFEAKNEVKAEVVLDDDEEEQVPGDCSSDGATYWLVRKPRSVTCEQLNQYAKSLLKFPKESKRKLWWPKNLEIPSSDRKRVLRCQWALMEQKPIFRVPLIADEIKRTSSGEAKRQLRIDGQLEGVLHLTEATTAKNTEAFDVEKAEISAARIRNIRKPPQDCPQSVKLCQRFVPFGVKTVITKKSKKHKKDKKKRRKVKTEIESSE